MQQIFSKILKRHKLFYFVFLFLIITGILIPQICSAFAWSQLFCAQFPKLCMLYVGTGVANETYNKLTDSQTTAGDKIWGKIGAPLKEVGRQTLMAFVGGITFLLIIIFGTLANIAGQLLIWVMNLGQFVSYTHITGDDANIAVAAGWPLVRNLANMFVALGFIIIGIATALRIREYEAKKLLPKLIIAALLINFSLLICGIFIDGSNIAMMSFGTGGTGENIETKGFLSGTWIENVWGQAEKLEINLDEKNAADYVGRAIGMVFQDIVMIVVFSLFFFLLLARYFALWILVILSPLAFVCYVFPFTKKFFDMWWNNFFQWCIIGIPAMFFLWLADTMGEELFKTVSSPEITSTLSGNLLTSMTYLVPGIFLLIGFLFSLQTSAMGAGTAISAFRATGRGAAKGGGALKELAGRTETGRAIKERSTMASARLAQATGFAGATHVADTRAKMTADSRKQVDSMRTSSAVGDKQRYEQLVRSGRGAMGAAAVASANENGDLSKILNPNNTPAGLNTINQRVAHATQFGHQRSEFENKDYRLAGSNEIKIDQALAAQGIVPPGATPAERVTNATNDQKIAANQRARQTQLRANLPKMSPAELRNIDTVDLNRPANDAHRTEANYNFVKDNLTPNMIEQFATSAPDKIAALQDHIGSPGAVGTLAHDQNEAAAAGNMREADKLRRLIDSLNRL